MPPDDLRTGTGYVVHPDGHTRLAYRDLVPVAQVPRSFPDFVDREHRPHLTDEFYGEAPLSPLRPDPQKPGAVPLKTHRTFRLLGVDAPRVDIPAKVDGSARFGIDTVLPDLTYAMVETGPVAGCAPVAVKDGDARAVPGVIDVLRLPHGVAVIGSTISALQKARTRLSIQWSSNPAAESFESRDTLDRYLRIARDTAPQRGVRVLEIGDTAAARAALGGDGTVSFDVRSEFVYHATMEPQNATLRVAADGRSAEAWVSTQWPGAERDAVARILEIKPEAVTIHTPFVGGAFGRRQEPGAIIDAAYIAHQLRRPVKVLWTREDDLKRNPFRQALACHAGAAVSPDGAILAMHHRVVADSWFARMFPDLFEQYSDTDPGNWTGALHAYDVPLQTVDCVTERGPIDVCYLRGIGVDLPKVQSIFEGYVRTHGLQDRIAWHAADIWHDPFPAAEVIVLGHMLHGWGLERKKIILQKAYDALPDGGAVLVYDAIIDDDRRENTFGLLFSLNMLIENQEGAEYTFADCQGWMRDVGFRETYARPLAGPESMVVGIK